MECWLQQHTKYKARPLRFRPPKTQNMQTSCSTPNLDDQAFTTLALNTEALSWAEGSYIAVSSWEKLTSTTRQK
eukprot:scaffold27962_cov148-Skeletonema_menzelii.AAC.2